MKLKFSISQKLIYGFGLILVVVLLNSILTIVTLVRSTSLNNQVTGIYGPTVKGLGDMDMMITQSKMLIRNWVFVDKQPGTPDKIRLAELHGTDWPNLKLSVQPIAKEWESPEDLAFIENVFQQTDSLFELHQHIMQNLSSFDSYEDVMVFFEAEDMVVEGGGIISLSDQIVGDIAHLTQKYSQKNERALDQMGRAFTTLGWVVIVMGIILVLASISIGWVLYNSIVQPLTKGVEFAKAIGGGDLTAQVDINQDDEIGILANELSNMANNLKDIVHEIGSFGYSANDITDVILTHLHFDHCGYSTRFDDNRKAVPTFPNATYWLSQAQWDNYRNPSLYEKDSLFAENIEPIADANQLQLINEDIELFEGLSLKLYDGHTPGQIAVFIDTITERIIYPGDV